MCMSLKPDVKNVISTRSCFTARLYTCITNTEYSKVFCFSFLNLPGDMVYLSLFLFSGRKLMSEASANRDARTGGGGEMEGEGRSVRSCKGHVRVRWEGDGGGWGAHVFREELSNICLPLGVITDREPLIGGFKASTGRDHTVMTQVIKHIIFCSLSQPPTSNLRLCGDIFVCWFFNEDAETGGYARLQRKPAEVLF